MSVVPLPLLAFGFASPMLLWGLALGGIPVIIHLLHKRKFREMPWAAMRFLLEAARKNSRRLRLEQLILLTVRSLILILVALALAQPYVETFGTYFQAEMPTHRIIVVDTSFSMGYQLEEFSGFDRAKVTARKIVDAAKQGDALNLVRISDLLPRAVVRQLAYQKSQVIDEIEQLQLTHERGDLFATLQTVAELLREAPEIPNKEVYLISDFQWATWSPDSSGQKAQIQRLLKEISETASLILLDLGHEQAPNAAVISFAAQDSFVTKGQNVRLQATFRNYGDTVLPQQLVELYVDKQLRETRRLDLAPGVETTAHFEFEFSTSGEHQLEVRLESDPLGIDNRRWFSLPVKDGLNVLLVNGKPSGRMFDNATHYLQTVLSPGTTREEWHGGTRSQTVKDGELTSVDLSQFDCVFLCNVGLIIDREAEILRAYVESGGGLIFCLGDQVKVDYYNRVLYRDGTGILPAKLGNRIGSGKKQTQDFPFDPDNLKHPIVNKFEGNPGTGLERTITFEYVRVKVPEDSQASVVLRYTSGDPVIVEAPVGRGRSILITTSVDVNWGTWPVQRSFPPLIHEMVKFAVAGRWNERQRLVGEPLTRAFPIRAFSVPVTLTLPDGREKSIRLSEAGNFASISYDATNRSGPYEVELGPPLNRREWYAVNVDSRESDLTKVTEKELQALPGIEFVYHTHWQDFSRKTDVALSQRGGLTRWLLLAVLCLLFVEQLMAWRFFYGFLLLYVVVAIGFVQPALQWNAVAGVLLMLALLVGFAAIAVFGRQRADLPRPVSSTR